MAKSCPTGTQLRAFSHGRASEEESGRIQGHLEECLACARAVEQCTQDMLETLTPTHELVPQEHREAVARIIAQATNPTSIAPRPLLESVLEKLEPPVIQDSVGTFARYHILEVAGSGGMAVVFRAHDPALDRVVALKVVAPRFALSPEDSSRFLAEARAMAALRHDHIAVVHTVGTVHGLPYLVMPLYPDGNLDRWLEKHGPLEAGEVVEVALQISRAMEHSHAAHLIHRDIKPSNLLLDGGLQRVLVTDFGLVKSVRAARGESDPVLAGTFEYMAPEQALGRDVDARTDLYAVGAVMYHMVTGKPPRSASGPIQARLLAEQGVVATLPRNNPRIPGSLIALIEQLLSPEPDRRPATAQTLTGALEKIRKELQPKRSWALKLLVTSLAILLVFAGILFALEKRGSSSWISTALCLWRGDGFLIRGHVDSFKDLRSALAAARPGEIIELRFNGERTVAPVRIQAANLTLRAVPGFSPILMAAETPQPWLMTSQNLSVEGLTLARRGGANVNFPLFFMDGSQLTLQNCSLVRVVNARTDRVAEMARSIDPMDDNPSYRPFVVLAGGASLEARNSILRGFGASGVEVRERLDSRKPSLLRFDQCYLFVNSGLVFRGQSALEATVHANRTAILSRSLVEVPSYQKVRSIELNWNECTFEKSRGTLLRTDVLPEAWSAAAPLQWRETRVVYSEGGVLAIAAGRQRMDDPDQWRRWFQLAADAHRVIALDLFPKEAGESPAALHADELAMIRKLAAISPESGPDPSRIGPGTAYQVHRQSR